MNKFILTLFLLSFMLFTLPAKETAPQPIVSQFLIQEEAVYEHLAVMLESAMQLAVEHENAQELQTDEATRKIVLKQAMTGFLNFDVRTLDNEFIDSDPQKFLERVVALFNETSVEGLSVEVSTIESSRPDKEETSEKLRMLMIGYYFAVMKENNFDLSVKIDWRFKEIQVAIRNSMIQKIQTLTQQFQQMIQAELMQREKDFVASFSANHKEIVFILKSFKVYATQILIDQLRLFYFSLVENPSLVDPQNAQKVFQRTIDMWMVAYRVCEKECEPKVFANLLPNFLEDMMITRIKENTKVVGNPLVKTFYAKFLAFLFQQNFQVNTPQEDNEGLMNLNERYAMYIYRGFFSKGTRSLNRQLSVFLNLVHSKHSLNFLAPPQEMATENKELFNKRVEMNHQYIVDLILYLDFPQIDEEETQDLQKQKIQEISFTDEEVLLLVQGAANWFAYDLDKLNTEEIVLNWFVDFENPNAFDDYVLMYETLLDFRRNYDGEDSGEDLNDWLDENLVDPVKELPRDDSNRQHKLSQYWLMKAINMINVLSGKEYFLTMMYDSEEQKDLVDDIILYFRRIITREEFSFMKNAMLSIFAFFKTFGEEKKVYSTDLEDDKFLYEVWKSVIECEILPEILNTKLEITEVTFKDKDDSSSQSKKILDNGSNNSSPIISEDISTPKNSITNKSQNSNEIIETSSNSSSQVSESQVNNPIPIVINKKETSRNSSESSNIEIKSLVNNSPSKGNNSPSVHTSNKSPVVLPNKTSERTPQEIIETSSNNTSEDEESVSSNHSHGNRTPTIIDKEDVSPTQRSRKSIVQSERTSEQTSHPNVHVSSQNSTSSPQEIIKKSEHSGVLNEVIETSSNSSSHTSRDVESQNSEIKKESPKTVINNSQNSSHQVIEISEHTSNNIVETSSNSSSKKSSEKSNPVNVVVIPSTSPKTSPKVSPKTSERSVNSGTLDNHVEISENTNSQKVVETSSNSSSERSINSIAKEIEKDVTSHSSDTDQDVLTPKNDMNRQNKSDNSSSPDFSRVSSENSSQKSKIHPLVPSSSQNSSEQSSHKNDIVDVDSKRKNLVYEVTGKLTPTQRKTFEFADDVFASIKDLQVQVDEYGNEVEYVYVQIVRKNSDCYEELLKFV